MKKSNRRLALYSVLGYTLLGCGFGLQFLTTKWGQNFMALLASRGSGP